MSSSELVELVNSSRLAEDVIPPFLYQILNVNVISAMGGLFQIYDIMRRKNSGVCFKLSLDFLRVPSNLWLLLDALDLLLDSFSFMILNLRQIP